MANIVSVAEYTILMILQIAKNTYATERVRRFGPHDFNSRNTHCGVELAGKILGIVGMEKIGRLVAEKAKAAFGMQIRAFDPFCGDCGMNGITMEQSLEALLPQIDFLTLHIPLVEGTRNLLDARAISLMKPTARIVNASRGGVVNEQALLEALRGEKLAGAALDVFEKEPNTYPNPLYELDNVIVSPHVAGMTIESADRVGIHAAMGIDDVLSGREPGWPVPM